MTGVQGGKFWSGFAAGAVSSIAATAMIALGSSSQYSSGNYNVDGSCEVRNFGMDHNGLMTAGTLVAGAITGGAAAALSKGNFWDGAVTGLMVSGLNHAMHAMSSTDDSEAVREKVASNAESKMNSSAYALDAEIDNFDSGSWKCNKFVYDVTTESGASPGTPNGMFNTSPPTAGQWANPNYDIKNWRVVSSPRRGDVVAYSNPNYTSATGHTGIMVSKTHSISAGEFRVQKNDFGSNQSRIQGGSPYVYRRYYAPIKVQVYYDPYWSRKNRAGGF